MGPLVGERAPPEARVVLADLRRARRAHHPRHRHDLAYRAYATAIALTLIGVPLAPAGRRVLSGSLAFHVAQPRVDEALGFGLTGVLLLVLLAALRFSTWQGPVVLSAAMVAWVATLPLPRRDLLWRRLGAALLGAAGLGALLGAALTLLLAAFSRAAPLHLLAGSLAGTATLAVLATALGVLVERSRRLARAVVSASPAVAVAALACLAGCGAALFGDAPPGSLRVLLLWSGPWGWAAQPMAAAARAGAPAWPVGLGVLGAATAAAVAAAFGLVGSIPTRELRMRAGALGGARSGLFLHDLRAVHRAAAAARPSLRRRTTSLPLRGRRLGLVVWRDAVGLVRAPVQVASAAFFVALAVVAVTAGPLGSGPSGLVVLAVLLAYGAASRLVEPVRLEADEPTLASRLLMSRRTLALAHLVAPSVVLFLLGSVAAGIAASLPGFSASGLAALVGLSAVAWPLVVLGALIAAHKGPTPYASALTVGQDFGVLVLVAWAVAGPLFALLALAPSIGSVLAHRATLAGALAAQLVVGAVAFVVGVGWLRHRVRRAGGEA